MIITGFSRQRLVNLANSLDTWTLTSCTRTDLGGGEYDIESTTSGYSRLRQDGLSIPAGEASSISFEIKSSEITNISIRLTENFGFSSTNLTIDNTWTKYTVAGTDGLTSVSLFLNADGISGSVPIGDSFQVRNAEIYQTSGGGSDPEADAIALFGPGDNGGMWHFHPDHTFQLSGGTTAVTADGDPIGYAEDLSGKGNHITQATSGSRPTIRNSGSDWWAEFDGTDDILTVAGSIAFSSSGSTIVAAIRIPGSQTGFRRVWGHGDNSSNDALAGPYIGSSDNNVNYFIRNDGQSSVGNITGYVLATFDDTWRTIEVVDTTNSIDISTNHGTPEVRTSIHLGTYSFDIFSVGGHVRGGAQEEFTDGDIAAIFAIDRELSSGDLTTAFDWVNSLLP